MAVNVLAECRPMLGACYFFIQNVPTASISSVEVEEQRIRIGIPDELLNIILPPTLTLIPGCIVGQMNANCSLTFRTRIKNFNPTTNLCERRSEYSPQFGVSDSVSVNCSFCQEPLIGSQLFSRVLPLPSSDEPNDFFCHRHSDEPMSLDPKSSDFFYSYFFYKIHVDNFIVPPSDCKFKCPKCFELLGEVRGNCVKLWNSVVSLTSDEEQSIEKFLKSLAHFIKNLPVQMNKFVFTCGDGSSMRYTLIWIMDRALVILESPKDSDSTGSIGSNVHLESKVVMKLLYSHHEQCTDIAEDWMKSLCTSVIPIHPRIEKTFLNHLKHAGSLIPADAATVDGMGVSYLDSW